MFRRVWTYHTLRGESSILVTMAIPCLRKEKSLYKNLVLLHRRESEDLIGSQWYKVLVHLLNCEHFARWEIKTGTGRMNWRDSSNYRGKVVEHEKCSWVLYWGDVYIESREKVEHVLFRIALRHYALPWELQELRKMVSHQMPNEGYMLNIFWLVCTSIFKITFWHIGKWLGFDMGMWASSLWWRSKPVLCSVSSMLEDFVDEI